MVLFLATLRYFLWGGGDSALNSSSLFTMDIDFNCSIQNWIDDLYWKQLDINYPAMPDDALVGIILFFVLFYLEKFYLFSYVYLFQVHHGFYFAYHNTTMRPGILNGINRAKSLYGDLKIILTGHSMGGAMASFCGLDLAVSVTMLSSRIIK